MIVTYPPVFAEAMDRFPALAHERLVVVVNQLAARDRAGARHRLRPAPGAGAPRRAPRLRGRSGRRSRSGCAPPWPPTRATRRPIADTWTPLIDAAAWAHRAPLARRRAPAPGARPPRPRPPAEMAAATAQALLAAYCAGEPCEVRFLGGAAHARARLAALAGELARAPFGGDVPRLPRRARRLPALPPRRLCRGVRPGAAGGDGRRGAGDPAARVRAELRRRPRSTPRPTRSGRWWSGSGATATSGRRAPPPAAPSPPAAATTPSPPAWPGCREATPALLGHRAGHAQWELVPELLAALAAQTLGRAAFEVVIVDNDPAARPPRRRCAPAAGARRVPCPAPGSYAARNAGAAAARGELARLHRRRLPARARLARRPRRRRGAAPPGALLAGPVRMLPPRGAETPTRSTTWSAASPRRATSPAATPPPPTSRCRRAVFAALGGFDPARRSGGDAELCRRAGRAGHPLRLVAAAVVAHPAAPTGRRSPPRPAASRAARSPPAPCPAASPGRCARFARRSPTPAPTSPRRTPRRTGAPRWRCASASGGSSSPRPPACSRRRRRPSGGDATWAHPSRFARPRARLCARLARRRAGRPSAGRPRGRPARWRPRRRAGRGERARPHPVVGEHLGEPVRLAAPGEQGEPEPVVLAAREVGHLRPAVVQPVVGRGLAGDARCP